MKNLVETVNEEYFNLLNECDCEEEELSEEELQEVYYILVESKSFEPIEKPILAEAEYRGKKVRLNKPMRGDVKKYKVYVKNDKGNVVKVNFGDPNMRIRRNDPQRRKNFRARHNCDTAKDRTTPRYWSCRFWSKTNVSDMVS